jgi:hypothetical protein
MMSAPPIVGVPRFEAWAAGPSSRMTSPSWRARAPDEPRRDDERDEQRRQRRGADARRDVAEDVRAGDALA